MIAHMIAHERTMVKVIKIVEQGRCVGVLFRLGGVGDIRGGRGDAIRLGEEAEAWIRYMQVAAPARWRRRQR